MDVDRMLDSLLNGDSEEKLRQKLNAELTGFAATFRSRGLNAMASGLDFAALHVLGLAMDAGENRIFSEELTGQVKKDGDHIPETDAMGREKFWEDLGRPDGD